MRTTTWACIWLLLILRSASVSVHNTMSLLTTRNRDLFYHGTESRFCGSAMEFTPAKVVHQNELVESHWLQAYQ